MMGEILSHGKIDATEMICFSWRYVFYIFASNENSHARLIYMVKVSLAHSWNRAKRNNKESTKMKTKKWNCVGAALLFGCCRRCRLILFIFMFHVRIISFSTQLHREILYSIRKMKMMTKNALRSGTDGLPLSIAPNTNTSNDWNE